MGIHFHSPSGRATVHGAERHYAGVLCTRLLEVALGLHAIPHTTSEVGVYRQLAPAGSYLLQMSGVHFLEGLKNYLLVSGYTSDEGLIMPGTGEKINPYHAALNTAVVMGSDPVRFLAKLHGQCELHCYVEGEHRAWLAGIIEQGMKENILRTGKNFVSDEYGWSHVVDLLKARDDEPVVTSFSVTDRFPNVLLGQKGGWQPTREELQAWWQQWNDEYAQSIKGYERRMFDEDDTDIIRDGICELWETLPEEEQWKWAMQGLRILNETARLEIHPDTLSTQKYGKKISGFDIYHALFQCPARTSGVRS